MASLTAGSEAQVPFSSTVVELREPPLAGLVTMVTVYLRGLPAGAFTWQVRVFASAIAPRPRGTPADLWDA